MKKGIVKTAKAVPLIAVAVLLVVAMGCANPTAPDGPATPDVPHPKAPTLEWDSITIDFEDAVAGITGPEFAGTGILLDPGPGQLDGDNWQIQGFSDGSLEYGQEAATGDLARGASAGGVSTGGLYAFEVAQDNTALGVQATAGDFAPGSLGFRIPAPSGRVEELAVTYTLWCRNDQDRATLWQTEVSVDGTTWTPVETLSTTTPGTADADPAWMATQCSGTINGTALDSPGGGYLHLRWTGSDHAGSGGRDEIGVDDITIEIGWR